MPIRCAHCTRTLALPDDGTLPAQCPHCAEPPGPGKLGPYVPIRLLAAGGMGEVYVARHEQLGTEVAVKLLPAQPAELLPALRERFAREAQLTARVRHPGIVQVLASDFDAERPYLVLELVRGRTLRQQLANGPFTVAAAARTAAATADVLAAAHAEGVLHRDIKPDNVMLQDDGAVRVLDFGIARAIADDAPLTRTGELVGTPEYMAPEQLLEGPEGTTERTDVHALGVLLYELLTGRSPFHGSNVFQALKRVESLLPPPPSTLRAGIPPSLDAVVAAALAKTPDERCPDAATFAARVRAAVPTTVPVPPLRTAHWTGAHVVALVLALLLGGIAITALARSAPRPPDPASDSQRPAATANGASVRAECEHLLAAGRWAEATALGDRAVDAGDPSLLPLAREGFVRSHVVWPLALRAPAWLSRCDERQRRRWFGSSGAEPGDIDPVLARQRAQLLGQQAVATDAAAPTDPLPSLLAIATMERSAAADAFAAFAQRLPLDAAEHWFARLGERHARGDRQGALQAAELAWLHGAGELAVLLEAWLRIAPDDDVAPWRRLPRAELRKVATRVGAANVGDSPASTLLLALLQALHGEPIEPGPVRAFPADCMAAAADWFVAAASREPMHRPTLLAVAAALERRPDYQQAPWRDLDAAQRTWLEAKVARGR